MPQLPVAMQQAPGVIRDLAANLLGPDGISDANGMRFSHGFVHRVRDPISLVSSPGVTANWLLPVSSATSPLWIVATATKVYALQGALLTEISRTTGGAYISSGRWSGGILNGIPVISNAVDVPQAWSPPAVATKLVNLPNWPAGDRAKVIRPFGPVLVAIGMTISGTDKPWTIKTSHPADPGTLPISWDQTDTTKDVLMFDIADTADKLLDGLQLGEIFIIYKENSTWALRPYGGTGVSQLFRVSNVFREIGLLARDCVQNVRGGLHLVVTQDDIILHSGTTGSLQRIGYGRIVKDFFRELSTQYYYKSYTYRDETEREIVLCFVPEGETEIRKAWAWNWEENKFSPRSDVDGKHFIAVGSYTPKDANDTWDGAPAGSWDQAAGAWDPLVDPRFVRVLLAAGDDELFRFDEAFAGGTGPEDYLERQDFHFAQGDNGPAPAPHMFKFYRFMQPFISAPDDTEFSLTFGYRNDLGVDTPIIWKPTKLLKLRRGTRVGVFIRTRYLSWRISCTKQVEWSLSGYMFEVDLRGRN